MPNLNVQESERIKVEPFIGELEVIATGLVHSNDRSPLLIKLDDLEMIFKFATDKNTNGSLVNRVVEGNRLIWTLINFKNINGEGLIEPVELGSAYKRTFYASFWIWTPVPESDVRLINYVLYLGRIVDE